MKKSRLLIIIVLIFCQTIKAQTVISNGDTAKIRKSEMSSISSDSLLKKIESLHNTLNHINNVSERGFDTKDIETELPKIQDNITSIKDNLTQYSSVLNARNLQLYSVLLADMQSQLIAWRTSLFDYNRQIVSMSDDMRAFAEDSSIQQLRKDTLFKKMYQVELKDIRDKWKTASSFTNTDLTKMTELQAAVSNTYFSSIELQNLISRQKRKSGKEAFGQEYPYLWNTADTGNTADKKVLSKKAYEGQSKLIKYYFDQSSNYRFWFAFIALLFFVWVFSSYRKIKKFGQANVLEEFDLKYVTPIPIAGALVIALNIAPFFDLNPPSVYVNIVQFFMLIVLSFVLWKSWPRRFFIYWIAIVVLYFAVGFTNFATDITWTYRIWLLVINIASIVLGVTLFRLFKRALLMKGFVKTITCIYIVLNIIAIFCNIQGRVSIAKVLNIAAVFGLSQVIGLSVFIHLMTEAFHLQMLKSRLSGGKTANFNYEKIQGKLNKMLTIIAIVCWSIIFASNLNIYPYLYKMFTFLLNKPHEIGSTTFTARHILLFFIILYISNLLQKYLGYFLGETEDDVSGEMSKKSSRLAIIRLVLLLVGFLLAMAASGLPVDKVTVVLGALGVGIGLGLQNIVNNLVSGVILIFERPLQLGDFIEIGDKKGKVKNIGIRSSRMLTQEGAEIVVPNGDLLSGRLTNWTLSNNHIRTVLVYKLQPTSMLEIAKECIMSVLDETQGIVHKMPKEILITNITDVCVELKVQFWILNINKEHETRSEVLFNIYNGLKAKEIVIV
ncbi:mechanosensitive ion channel family protein [Chitinophagaceae bacterium LWZ2-11]